MRPKPAAKCFANICISGFAPGASRASPLLQTQRCFSTAPVSQRRRSPYPSLSQKEVETLKQVRSQLYKSYTDADKAELAKRYTPAQLAAIEAGEAAISPEDLAVQARVRSDPFKLNYLDDFARVEPTIDKRPSKLRGEGQDYEEIVASQGGRAPNITPPDEKLAAIADVLLEPGNERDDPDYDPRERDLFAELWEQALDDPDKLPTNEAVARVLDVDSPNAGNRNIDVDALVNALSLPPGKIPTAADATKSRTTSLEKITKLLAEYDTHPDPPDVAPAIPRIHDPTVRWTSLADSEGASSAADDETALAYARLAKQINQSVEEIRRYRTKMLVSHRVVNQTRLGKISSVYFLCVAGNEKGMVGIGEGKAAEGDEAMRVAKLAAIRNMKPIRRYEGRTIYGEVKGKVGAVELVLAARPPGFGLRVSSHVFEIARCAGIHDLSARVTRSRNPMNVAKAVWQALLGQRDPEEIARSRGKKLVDVRKVYYAGLV